MAGLPLVNTIAHNNNSSHTDAFRNYVKDNFIKLREQCIVLTVDGRSTSRYRNNSHAMWLELGLDPKYCMIADYLNGIDGQTDLMYLSTVYLPDSRALDTIARRVNNR